MATYDGLIFDGDNHDYEAEDAFMRYVPRRMQKRCVQWVEMDGKRRHLVAGKLNHAVGNMGPIGSSTAPTGRTWKAWSIRGTSSRSWTGSRPQILKRSSTATRRG